MLLSHGVGRNLPNDAQGLKRFLGNAVVVEAGDGQDP